MPIKYIGRKTDFKGKTLWEIVGNLKNFGVGRIVARNMFERYPESSYYKILEVNPLPMPKDSNIDNVRKVNVLVEKTFRGVTYPNPIRIESASYKTDYKLIPKDEENDYCKQDIVKQQKILPSTLEFPPILKELLQTEMLNKGEDLKIHLKLPAVYNRKLKCKIATDNELPSVVFNGIVGTKYPSLYSGIKLN